MKWQQKSGLVYSRCKRDNRTEKNWNAIINIGKVDALLDSEMQQQVLIMKQELGFRYVRVWNIFVQDMYEEKTEAGIIISAE